MKYPYDFGVYQRSAVRAHVSFESEKIRKKAKFNSIG